MDLPDGNRRLTTRGVFFNPNIEKCIKCYVDTEFAGRWDQTDSDNSENVMLHTGYVITYA